MSSAVATKGNRAVWEQSPRQERRRWIQPQVNIVETKDAYILEAEMPGVSKEGLEVLLEGNELTILGRKNPVPGEVQVVYRESYDYDFRRTFELDPAIETSRIAARMDSGVLHLELPKAEKVKPRKIAID
jgi:HSP20 family protein